MRVSNILLIGMAVSTFAGSLCPAQEAGALVASASGQNMPGSEGARPGKGMLAMTLLVRRMVMDKYADQETGILTESGKTRLLQDAEESKKREKQRFLARFDKDGDGKLSPEEYQAFRAHMEQRRHRRPHGPGPHEGKPGPDAPGQKSSPEDSRVKMMTPGKKVFRVAPGLFLLSRELLLEKYDKDKDGRISPPEHRAMQQDAEALYNEQMKLLTDTYDVDKDGVLSPIEREQALAAAHHDSPLVEDDVDEIDMFIRADISEILLNESDDGGEQNTSAHESQ